MGSHVFSLFLGVIMIASVHSDCPLGWVYNPLHKSCLLAMTPKVTWFAARDTCSALSSTLVHVDSMQMIDFLVDNMKGPGRLTDDEIWIATNDLQSHGDWRGAFGAKMTFLDWKSGQPSGGDCVKQHLQSSFKKQETKSCDGGLLGLFPPTNQYVCEMSSQDVSAVRFKQLPSSSFSTVLADFGVAEDVAFNGVLSAARLMECAWLCLKAKSKCEVFLFNPAARKCKFLRVFPSGLIGGVLSSLGLDFSVIANDGSKVFLMNG